MEPNFEDYSYQELREALHNINREKFPERVERIQGLLNEKESTGAYKQEVKVDYESIKYSTFGLRFMAGVFDYFVLIALTKIYELIVQLLPDVLAVIAGYVSMFIMLAYSILMHTYFGQTVGKMVVGVKVVRNSDEGAIGFNEALLRDLVPFVLLLMLVGVSIFATTGATGGETPQWVLMSVIAIGSVSIFWNILEILSMLFNEKRRAVHDFIAGTVVIRCKEQTEGVKV